MSAKPQNLPKDDILAAPLESTEPQVHSLDGLLPAVDYPAPFEGTMEHEPKVIIGTPSPAVQRATASNPLDAIKAMSEEEKIALFS